MANLYEDYKPLRNQLRKYNLDASLRDIWDISRHILNNDVPPPAFLDRHGNILKQYVFPWDLLLLTREIVLNANPIGARRLNSFSAIGGVINTLRKIEDAAARHRLDFNDVMHELHRIGHRQFPWQKRQGGIELVRYLKIFGADEVEAILLRTTGLGIREFYFIGIEISGHLLKHYCIDADQHHSSFGIKREQSIAFFAKLSSSIEDLRHSTIETQKYDEMWEYTWNPLEAKPLIALDHRHPNRLHCPLPELLLRRISHGLYYDLANASGFDGAFGRSFQKYIGEIICSTFPQAKFQLFGEAQYSVGKNIHHGADWIISGHDANLFIECKTKRMRQDAKFSAGGMKLENEVGLMADAIVQLYKNIVEAEEGKSHWPPNGLKIYPLVLTLEDWYLFSPHTQNMLLGAVTKRLKAMEISEQVLISMPYTMASSREFEVLGNVIQEVGILQFFSNKTSEGNREWMLEAFARNNFPDTKRTDLTSLFFDELKCLLPEEATA